MLVIEHKIYCLYWEFHVAFGSWLFFGLLQFVDEVVPETLKAAAGDGCQHIWPLKMAAKK